MNCRVRKKVTTDYTGAGKQLTWAAPIIQIICMSQTILTRFRKNRLFFEDKDTFS